MKKSHASEVTVDSDSSEVVTEWDTLIEKRKGGDVSWDDLANETMQNDEAETTEGDPVEKRPEYDETLYGSESEYLAAQCAAMAREDTDQPVMMTARQMNRQLFKEIGREQDGSVEFFSEKTVETIPENDVDEVMSDEKEPDEGVADGEKGEEVEIPTEKWFGNAIGLLDATMPSVQQLTEMNRGSRHGEEMVEVLATCVRDMLEGSAAQLAELQSGRNLGKFELAGSVYTKRMTEQYNHATQALGELRKNAMSKPLPQQLLGGIISNIQQVENNLKMVSDLVAFKPQPMVTFEKVASDEAELEQIYGVE